MLSSRASVVLKVRASAVIYWCGLGGLGTVLAKWLLFFYYSTEDVESDDVVFFCGLVFVFAAPTDSGH
jgi:hypothetical protein